MIPQIMMGAYAGARLYSSYRYWSDYSKNTRMQMKYPMRTLAKDISPVFMFGKMAKRRPVRYVNNYYRNYYR